MEEAVAASSEGEARRFFQRSARPTDRELELQREVSELERQSHELKATQRVYAALLVPKRRAHDEATQRISARLRDQSANLRAALDEVKQYSTNSTDVPMTAMMRWSELLCRSEHGDSQTAAELFLWKEISRAI